MLMFWIVIKKAQQLISAFETKPAVAENKKDEKELITSPHITTIKTLSLFNVEQQANKLGQISALINTPA